jgi:hypothetical protein
MHILSKFGPRPGEFPPLDAKGHKEHGNIPHLIVICPVDVKIIAAVVFLAKFYYKLNDVDRLVFTRHTSQESHLTHLLRTPF